MQKNLINLSALTLIIAGLTACGGGSSSGSKKSSTPANSSVAMISSVAASSVAPASSVTPASSSAASSIDPSAEKTTLLGTVSNTIPTNGVSTGTNNIEIAEIGNCGVGISQPTKSFSIFADYVVDTQNQTPGNLTGWNHVTSTATWANVSKVPSAYNLPSTTVADVDCNNVDTFSMILIKKIANWDQQHGNGFERSNMNMLPESITFGKVKSITVDLKINGVNTIIPTVDSLIDTYVPNYVTAGTINALEDGKVNLDITFYEKNVTNSADSRAKVIFEIDQNTMSDKWLRVTIPASALYYYSENNYSRTDSTVGALASVVIKGAMVVAETKRGNTLRNDIQGAWVDTTPETFKEVDVSFKKIELNLE